MMKKVHNYFLVGVKNGNYTFARMYFGVKDTFTINKKGDLVSGHCNECIDNYIEYVKRH